MTAVRAHQDFETCRFGFVSAVGVMAPGRRVVVGDGDRDGRPDLWSIDETSDSVVVSVYSYASGFQRRVRRVVTGIEPDPSNEYLIGDHNVDGYADLYAVERTAAGKRLCIDVWDGASDFASTIVGRNVNITDDTTGGTWHFALGDRDVDGVPDLYAFEAVDPVIAHISLGGKRFGGRPTTFDTGAPPSLALRLDVGDYDGDGRDDLYSIRTDGKLRVYLGGVQPAGADLSYWFRDPASWTAGDGCPTTASLADAITIGDITSDGVDEIAALHRKLGDTAYTVDIHNRATNKQVAEFAVSPTSTSFDLETLAVDGKVAVATLGRRHGDGLSVIRVQLVEGGAAISAFISGGGFIPADIEIGTDGNGDSFLAVAEYRLHPLVARVNTFTPEGVLVDTVNYGSFVPIDLEVVPDFTGDGEPSSLCSAPTRVRMPRSPNCDPALMEAPQIHQDEVRVHPGRPRPGAKLRRRPWRRACSHGRGHGEGTHVRDRHRRRAQGPVADDHPAKGLAICRHRGHGGLRGHCGT